MSLMLCDMAEILPPEPLRAGTYGVEFDPAL